MKKTITIMTFLIIVFSLNAQYVPRFRHGIRIGNTVNTVKLDSIVLKYSNISFYSSGIPLNPNNNDTVNVRSTSLFLVGDTIETPSLGRVIFKTSDSTFYGCRSTTYRKKWYKLNL